MVGNLPASAVYDPRYFVRYYELEVLGKGLSSGRIYLRSELVADEEAVFDLDGSDHVEILHRKLLEAGLSDSIHFIY